MTRYSNRKVHGDIAKRVIMRLEISREAKDKYIMCRDSRGMTRVGVTSKIILWFVGQTEGVQATILGLYPKFARTDLTIAVLKPLISK